ncbi:hypothetical protein BWX42_03255 [Dolosigranulum pigrum]|uniref:Uncharacterized protein n=1 Tax=Dolosigranulum pigrum TaxID=29394 RepID=A0A1S8KME7_9LACT|nr:hypothetical protein BWX42_03255 [Dolosigranulum pigrum]
MKHLAMDLLVFIVNEHESKQLMIDARSGELLEERLFQLREQLKMVSCESFALIVSVAKYA